MKTARMLALIAALVVAAAPAVSRAEGWGLPIWNPFAAKSKKSTTSFASKRKAEPSTWQKLTTGTTNTFKKTTTALNPWKADTKPRSSATGLNNGFRTAAKPKDNGTKWYKPGSWFSGEDKSAKEPASVTDFIGQPRVPY